MLWDVMQLDTEVRLLAEERFAQCHIDDALPGALDLLPDKATAERFKDPDLVDELKAVWLAREYALIAGRRPAVSARFVADVLTALFPGYAGQHDPQDFVARRLAIVQQLDELGAFG